MAEMRTTTTNLLLTALITGLLSGCGEAPDVRVYETDKPGLVKTDANVGVAVPSGSILLDGLVYDPPDDWVNQKPSSNFVMAQFAIPDGVKMTISRAGGDIRGNINRWRGQIGLPPQADLDPGSIETLEAVAGTMLIVDLAANEVAPNARRLYIAMLPDAREGTSPGQTWFFKFDGPADAIEKRLTEFDLMLRKLRWAEGGATNG